jgi:hypothetical protein
MIPLPYILGALVAVFVLGCATGYSNRDGTAKMAAAKAYKAAEGQRQVMQGQIDTLSAKYEAERERANKVLLERTNTIREYYNNVPAVAPSCALPDPMFGLLVNSVRDANAYATSELSADLPNPTSAAKPNH